MARYVLLLDLRFAEFSTQQINTRSQLFSAAAGIARVLVFSTGMIFLLATIKNAYNMTLALEKLRINSIMWDAIGYAIFRAICRVVRKSRNHDPRDYGDFERVP